jgi:4-hydroxybenzoate polyprenyltransferase
VSGLALLSLRMLRYRVAAMIWMFMLLAAAAHGGLADLSTSYVWAVLSLAASYVAATTVNDVADRDIDRINHPRDRGRPLVSGEASERQLCLLHVFAVAGALAAGALLGARGLALVGASLAVGWAYSLRPLLLSHRTYLAPAALGTAYVVVPYGLGLLVSGSGPTGWDVLFAASLYALFLARIVLKDFRDRAGDAAYGKPTLLLRFGEGAVCIVSLLSLIAGLGLLLGALRAPPVVALLFVGFGAAIGSRLWAVWRAVDSRAEQLAIGVGARMGNGLLLSVLGWLVLEGHGAGLGERTAFTVSLAAVFAGGFYVLLSRPDEAVVGYKG